MRRALALALLAAIAGCGSSGDDTGASAGGATAEDDGGADATDAGAPVVDLVADSNRDGRLEPGDPDEDGAEDAWDARHGAVMLANLDDDDRDGKSDADDDVVNGDGDVADLAPLAVRAWPGAPDGATARISATPAGRTRLFKRDRAGDAARAASWSAAGDAVVLGADELRAGVDLAVEALDVVRGDDATWRGLIDVTLAVAGADGVAIGEDLVRMRVAPLLYQWNTARTEAVFYTPLGIENSAFATALGKASQAASGIAPTKLKVGDPWAQDFFDVAHMTRPGPDGAPIGMRVAIKSAQAWRSAGKQALAQLRGPDWATLVHSTEDDDAQTSEADSMDSYGNWDVVPPYTKGSDSFPLGRNLWGRSDADHPDVGYEALVDAQAVQPSLHVDTSWLWVGHVDEITSWVSANSGTRGWAMLYASPAQARQMLVDLQTAGHGDAKLFDGLTDWDLNGNPFDATRTVDQALDDQDLMATSQAAQTRLDEIVPYLMQEIGLADDEAIAMPFLFHDLGGGGLVAWQPGTVNLLYFDGHAVVPKTFGPIVGQADPFADDATARLSALGIATHFADDWDVYHVNLGEVHCGTNVVREMSVAWWESGR